MKRTDLNFWVDAVAFAVFVFLVVTGVIMKFLLPAGGGHSLTIWGLDRHGWGDVHFWLSVGFLAACAFHLYLHWKWIFAVLRGRPREGSGMRLGLGVLGLTALLAIAAAPLLSPVERIENSRTGIEPRWGLSAEVEALQGSTTLADVIEMTGVSPDFLVQELGLPPDVSLDDRLGQIARESGFSVAEMREIVEQGRDLGDDWQAREAVVSTAPMLSSADQAGNTSETAATAPEEWRIEEEEHSAEHEDRQAGLSEIRGSTTVGELVEMGVSRETLTRELHLPAGIPLSERLGRLGRTYGFTLTEVRVLVETLH